MSAVTATPFGCADDGTPVTLYLLDNGRGMQARIMTHGATVVSLRVPDPLGKVDDVILGFDALDGYLQPQAYLGSVIGRCANRIAGAHIEVEGRACPLSRNDGPNQLHGGVRGFDKRPWRALDQRLTEGAQLRLHRTSPDGEEGYPGTLQAQVTYTLAPDQSLRIDYEATCDQPTVVNLTNHMYFNLAGRGSVLDHRLAIAASHYLPVGPGLIPTGDIAAVEGTPMDFRQKHAIGARLRQDHPQLGLAGGYDHNWVLDKPAGELSVVAELDEPITGRCMTVLTTEPGLQFYSGNQLDGTLLGRGGTRYDAHAGLCLEAQRFPDAPHHPHFPSLVLRPGQHYRQTTIYRFR